MADGKTQDAETLKKELETLQLQAQIAEEKKKLAAATQPDAPPSKDPQLDAAKRAADLAEQSKRLRDALPTPETKALEGKTTIDDKMAIESYTLAYESLAKIAHKIAVAVKAENPKKIFIHSEKDINYLLELRTFRAQIEVIRQAFKTATPPAPNLRSLVVESVIGAGALAVTAVKTLIDLIALFRTDTEIKSVEITLDDTALVASVANQLGSGIKVYDPAILPLGLSSSSFTDSAVIKSLDDLYAARQSAQQAVATAVAELADPDPAALKAQADALKEPLIKAEALFQAFQDALLKIEEASGTSELARLLRAEILAAQLQEQDSYLLYLKIVKAGGSNRVTQNRFSGSKVTHSGGAIITYILFHPDGLIASSDTFHSHSGFKSFED
jgi:hypothetical protein